MCSQGAQPHIDRQTAVEEGAMVGGGQRPSEQSERISMRTHLGKLDIQWSHRNNKYIVKCRERRERQTNRSGTEKLYWTPVRVYTRAEMLMPEAEW